MFATLLANIIQYSSIKVYLSAVRALHIDQGFPDPLQNCLRLQRVVRSIKCLQGDLAIPGPTHPRPLHVLGCLHFGVLWFPMCSRVYCAQLGQLLALASPDCPGHCSGHPIFPFVHAHQNQGIQDGPFHKGADIHIGRGRHPLCAVHAMMAYLSLRGSTPGPLFRLQDGQPLSRGIVTDWLRQIMAAAGVAGYFSSHSFRIGAATVAACNGIPDHLIQALGRWTSNAYQLYIRTPSEALASLSPQLS